MTILRLRSLGLLVLAVTLSFAVAEADTIVHDADIPLSTTNWSESLTIPQFNEAGCELDSVCFELMGYVEGSAKFENLDAAPATITMDLKAIITLQRPDTTPLVTTIPLAQTEDTVTEFDQVIDFGGTSGMTYPDLNGEKTESACVSDPADLALFTGTGDIVLPAVAEGASTGSGAGNLLLQFNTSAAASVQVTYFYTCPVSTEESTWGSIKRIFH